MKCDGVRRNFYTARRFARAWGLSGGVVCRWVCYEMVSKMEEIGLLGVSV